MNIKINKVKVNYYYYQQMSQRLSLHSATRPSSLNRQNKQNTVKALNQPQQVDFSYLSTYHPKPRRLFDEPFKPLHNSPPAANNTQIEHYTRVLISNNQSSQEQILYLKKQLSILKSEYQRSLALTIKQKTTHQQQLSQIKQAFNHQIQHLITQLKQILISKEQMQKQYKQLIIEINHQHEDQIHNNEQKWSRTEEMFKQRLHKLTNHLDNARGLSEKQYFQTTQMKVSFIKEIDQLKYQLCTVKQSNKNIANDNSSFVQIIRKLQNQLAQAKDKYQQTDLCIYRKEQEKNLIIIEMKTINKKLMDENSTLQTKLKQTVNDLKKKQGDMGKIQTEYDRVMKELDKLNTKLMQMSIAYEQSDKQKQRNIQEFNKLSALHEQSIQEYTRTVNSLESSNGLLIKQLNTIACENEKNLHKIEKQSEGMQSLKGVNIKNSEQVTKMMEMNKKYKKDNAQLIKQYEILSLDCRKFKEKSQFQQSHINKLQKINEHLKLSISMQKSTKNPIIREQNPIKREQNIETYSQKIQQQKMNNYALVNEIKNLEQQNNHLEQQNNHLADELKQLTKFYEQKLKQKQDNFKRRFLQLEKDIELIKGLKQQNPTYNKT